MSPPEAAPQHTTVHLLHGGTVSICLTGAVNAIISASGDRHRHYIAGLAAGLFALAFGLSV